MTILFLVLHLTALLVGGAIPKIRSVFTPIVGFYADALKMTNSWGMFGKPPASTNVSIEGVRANGSVVVLSTTDAHQRTFGERIRDTRMRKFEGRLADPADLNKLGDVFLNYYCREGKKRFEDLREVRVRNILHETRDDDGVVNRTARTEILASRRCDGSPVNRIPIPKRSSSAPSEGEP
ncbi:MAG: hypothetical protein U0414_20555 [Polyangiaceae bacterium]